MSNRSKPLTESRRDFLRKGVAVVGGAATLAVAGSGGANERATEEVEQGSQPSQKGYHVTPHIRDYYEKARF